MKKTEIFEYYAFGYDYGLIEKGGMAGYYVAAAKSELTAFFKSLEDLNLPVTTKVAEGLRKLLDEISNLTEDKLSESYSKKIKIEIDKIDPSLDAELHLKEAYILTEKRYSLDILMDDPARLLGNAVFASLSDSSKKDFSFACVQIALSQPTAAAFHLMRALEEQVKVLYFSYKKTKRLAKPMWGLIIEQLRNKRAPKPSEKVLSHLDNIRVYFRNPTQHPDMFYSLDEAQDLLNQTISAINMIHRELSIAR